MKSHMAPYADQNITQELANRRLTRDKVVAGWYSNRRVRQSVMHSHPYHEYVYMVGGKAQYHISGSRYELHPGELMLIPPETVHVGYYDTYDRLILQIDDAFWHRTLELTGLTALGHTLPDAPMIVDASAAYKWGVRGLIEQAAAAAGIPALPEREMMYHALLTQLALVIRQFIAENAIGKPAATSPLVALAVDYLQEHFREADLSVGRLAEYTYVSREHLSRVFKEYTSQSVHSYLTSLRMQSCRQDIAQGKSILDACLGNGFSNYSSFLKAFRKIYGITPQEYRTQLRSAMKQG